MPQLFTLPKVVPVDSGGTPLPGALLYFFQTGTSTPQATYQDVDLTTPHANPVEADAAGVFPAIYLDPGLPDYRVRLSTAADVQIWQLDDIPSNQNVATRFRIKADVVDLIFEESGASPNEGKWRIRANSGTLSVATLNDAEDSATVMADFARSGATPTQIDMSGTPLVIVDALQADSAIVNAAQVATTVGGTYAANISGLTATLGVTVTYRKSGDLVTLQWSANSGTSNTTAMTLAGTNMPAAIRPASTTGRVPVAVIDNGTTQFGQCQVASDGTITFTTGATDGVFTGSGTKGLVASTICYLLPTS